MNKKKLTLLAATSIASCMLIGTTVLAAGGNLGNIGFTAGATTYAFTLNSANAAHADGEVIATATGNPIALSFKNATASSGNFCALTTGGYISNTREVLGISKLNISFSGSIKVYAGALKGHWTTAKAVSESGEVELNKSSNFFKIEALESTTITSITATYACEEADPEGVSHLTSDMYEVYENEDDIMIGRICYICNEPVGKCIYHEKLPESAEATGTWNYKAGTYGFSLQGDGYYMSSNAGKNSTKAVATFTCSGAGALALEWKVSGEGSKTTSFYDFLTITKGSETLVKAWTGEGTLNLDLKVGDVITITYEKDSGISNEPDCAQFKIISTEHSYYALTPNSMGGSEVDPLFVINGLIEGSLPTPEREGYNFSGWYLENSYNTKVTLETKFDANAYIYAKWTEQGKANPLAGMKFSGTWYDKSYSETTNTIGITFHKGSDVSGNFTYTLASGYEYFNAEFTGSIDDDIFTMTVTDCSIGSIQGTTSTWTIGTNYSGKTTLTALTRGYTTSGHANYDIGTVLTAA